MLLAQKWPFFWTLIVSDIWKGIGYGSIIYLAAISGIPQELYEAAKIDGAGRFRQAISITAEHHADGMHHVHSAHGQRSEREF